MMGQYPYTLREVLKTSGSIAESTPKEVLKTSGPSTAQRLTHAEHMAHSSESKPSRSTSCASLHVNTPLANPTQRPQPEAAFPVPASDEAAKLSLRNENKAHEGRLNSQNAARAAEPPCMSNHGNTAVIGQLDRGSLESLTQMSHELEESHTLPPASSIGLSLSLNARVRVNASSSNPSSSQNIRVALPGPRSKTSEPLMARNLTMREPQLSANLGKTSSSMIKWPLERKVVSTNEQQSLPKHIPAARTALTLPKRQPVFSLQATSLRRNDDEPQPPLLVVSKRRVPTSVVSTSLKANRDGHLHAKADGHLPMPNKAAIRPGAGLPSHDESQLSQQHNEALATTR
jgi:hypothetical protein